MNIYVGNISRTATEQDLKYGFAAFGEVSSASIIKDKFSDESRGFGFVEMPNKEEADKAIAGLNGKDLKGRPLTSTRPGPGPIVPAQVAAGVLDIPWTGPYAYPRRRDGISKLVRVLKR